MPRARSRASSTRITVPLRLAKCAEVLGVEVTEAQVEDILTGFGLKRVGGGLVHPVVPGGFDAGDRPDRGGRAGDRDGRGAGAARGDFRRRVRRWIARTIGSRSCGSKLAGLGFHEARTLTLVSEKLLAHHFGGGRDRADQESAGRGERDPAAEPRAGLDRGGGAQCAAGRAGDPALRAGAGFFRDARRRSRRTWRCCCRVRSSRRIGAGGRRRRRICTT